MHSTTGTSLGIAERRKRRLRAAACAALLACLLTTPSFGKGIRVRDADGLRAAAKRAGPGSRIELEPGEHAGGILLAGLQGTARDPIVIAAREDPFRIR